ncbi:hypothetical protein [Reticulibacter mediterranei]|nr:hypothetical protein [Reticulibacter mediterranei]
MAGAMAGPRLHCTPYTCCSQGEDQPSPLPYSGGATRLITGCTIFT